MHENFTKGRQWVSERPPKNRKKYVSPIPPDMDIVDSSDEKIKVPPEWVEMTSSPHDLNIVPSVRVK